MIYFHHRISEDFDFFSDKFIVNELKNKIQKMLRKEPYINFELIDEKKNTYIFLLNNVRFSFFEYNYPLIKPLNKINNLKVASVEDIIAMKMIAIIQRGSKKDFFDIWYLLQKGYTITKMLSYAKEKYGELFSPGIFLKALIYFEDAEEEKGFEKEWEEIKKFLIEKVKEKIIE